MYFVQDSENLSHYDYTNGSADSESLDSDSDGFFELLIGENRPFTPIDSNLFTFVGAREDRRRARLARVSEEESIEESVGEGEGKVEREEKRLRS